MICVFGTNLRPIFFCFENLNITQVLKRSKDEFICMFKIKSIYSFIYNYLVIYFEINVFKIIDNEAIVVPNYGV